MTLNEAAALLGVTADTLRQQIAAGNLRGATKVGRDWQVEPWAVALYRHEHLRDKSLPYIGAEYPLRFGMRVVGDGTVEFTATAITFGEGTGTYGTGSTLDEALGILQSRMVERADMRYIRIDLPEGEVE